MRYRIFGQRTGLKVSELALGTGMFGTAFGYGAGPDEVRDILRGYAEAGGNFIDTADNYQLGQSETLIGEFGAPHRDDFIIASKYSRGAVAAPSLAVLGNNRKAMVQSVEASLKRLKTDRIDLYFVHMDDGVTPVDELARGLDDLVRAGKIVYGGLSNFPAWRVATAARTADLRGWAPIAAIQLEYSLIQRTTERELLPMAFRAYRRDVHAPLLFAIPEAQKIRRFVVSYPLETGSPEPVFDAVVEAWFDDVEDMDGLFLSENFRTKVDPDHVNFIDLSSVVRIVSEEIVVVA